MAGIILSESFGIGFLKTENQAFHLLATLRNGILSLETKLQLLTKLRIIQSGIARIKSKTLEAHGFRRLQKLIQHRQTFWTEDPSVATTYRLNDVFGALVGALNHAEGLWTRPQAALFRDSC